MQRAKEDVFSRPKWSGSGGSWRETFSGKGFLMNYVGTKLGEPAAADFH